MAWGSLLTSLIPAVNQLGTGKRQQLEGAGSYDIRTGEYYNPKSVERGYAAGALTNPMKVITDPNVSSADKMRLASSFLLGTWGANIGSGKRYREAKEAENARMGAMYQGISDKISGLPDYEISPEAIQKLEALQQSGETMKGLAGEATDIAQARTSQDAPGMAIEKGDIRQAVAGKMSAIQQIGGAGSLDAIVKTGAQEQGVLRGLNRENLAYKAQAQKDLSNALISEAQIGSQAAQMGAAGLQGMVQERGKVYESQLNKALTAIDFNINTLATEQLGISSQAQARAATQAGITSGLAQIGSSWLANKGPSGNQTSFSNEPQQQLYGANAPTTEGTKLNPSGNYGGLYNF